MPNKNPIDLLKEMQSIFNDNENLKQAIIFALEVENWPYDVWEYIDHYGISRTLDKRQYLLSMLKQL